MVSSFKYRRIGTFCPLKISLSLFFFVRYLVYISQVLEYHQRVVSVSLSKLVLDRLLLFSLFRRRMFESSILCLVDLIPVSINKSFKFLIGHTSSTSLDFCFQALAVLQISPLP